MIYHIASKDHWAYRSRDGALFAAYKEGNPLWIVTGDDVKEGGASESLSSLARECMEINLPFKTVAAERPVGRRFAMEFGDAVCQEESLTAYYCPEPVRFKRRGVLIRPDRADAATIAGFIEGFNREVLDVTREGEANSQTAAVFIRSGNLYCWYDKRITAMCWVAGRYGDMAKLNYIYVPEQFRNRGYAKAMASEVCSALLGKNALPVLYTGSDITRTNNLYGSLGFLPAGKIEMLRISNPNNILRTAGV